MESLTTQIKLQIPAMTLARLSFSDGALESLVSWAKGLPMANVGEASRQLYQAIRELNQWHTDPVTRFKMLEVLRPYIYTINSLLERHFLQASISLNEKQLKVANLSQALQSHLATGYKIVVVHSIKSAQPTDDRPAKVVTKAIHRAIADISQTVLRAMQLYCQPPEHAWLEINQLYYLAEVNNLTQFAVEDKQNKYLSSGTIADAFMRIHLLGAAKPNNLRQQDLAQLYNACELWTSVCKLTQADDESALFLVNLHRDRPAQYRLNLPENQKIMHRGLNVEALVQALKLWAANPAANNRVTIPNQFSETLISHAIMAWGIHWQRSFRRSPSQGVLQVCIGLSATHYYSAEQKDFDEVMMSIKPQALADELSNALHRKITQGTPMPADDVWSQAFDAAGAVYDSDNIQFDSAAFLNKYKTPNDERAKPSKEPAKYPAHQVGLINNSPGGYCLRWQGEAPAGLQAGEIIGIQEPNVAHWAIGVIRWIQQKTSKDTLLGIELLAPRAEVAAAQVLQKTGSNSTYLRALVLPAIKAIAQPATILLPHMPFRTGNKIELMHAELQGRFQLVKRLTSTNSFSQFQFRSAGATLATNHSTSKLADDDFDSIWGKL